MFMRKLREFIRGLFEATDSDEPSFMIALRLGDKSLKRIIEYQDSIGASDMRNLDGGEIHATIRYWNPKEGGDLDIIISELENIKFDNFECETNKVEVLGDSLSLMFDCPEIQNLYQKIDNILQDNGVGPSKYSEFKPHIALLYGEWKGNLPEIEPITLSFEVMNLVNDDDEVFWSLGARFAE